MREPRDALVLRHVGFVRAISMPVSATWPPEVHTFWPLTIHSSPSFDGPGGEPGQVGAGARLAEELAPRLRAGDDVADVEVDLLLRAVGGDGRRRQQQPEAGRRAERAEARRSPVCTRTASLRRQAPAVGVRRAATAPPSRLRPSRSHHSPTVRSGSQFSSSHARSSSTSSSCELGTSMVSVIPSSSRVGGASDRLTAFRIGSHTRTRSSIHTRRLPTGSKP